MEEKKKIKATKTSFAILDYIKQTDGATANEIAAECEISTQSAYKHLRTLIDVDAVKNENGVFVLGRKLSEYNLNMNDSTDYYKRYTQDVDGLATSLNAPVNYWSTKGQHCICLYQSQPRSKYNNPRELEESSSLADTIPGRTILAEYQYEDREAFFENETFETDHANFKSHLQKARERNILIETMVANPNWVSIAASFNVQSDSPDGAIEIVLPSERAQGIDLEVNIAGSLLNTINKLEVDTIDS